MKLEFGSGYSPTPGYLHVDANPSLPLVRSEHIERIEDLCHYREPHADVAADASEPMPWWHDGTIDEIRAVDVLEHISYRRTAATLREWARVLAPGGRLYVQVPDFAEVIRWFTEDGDGKMYQRGRQLARAGVLHVDPDDAMLVDIAEVILLGGHDDGTHVHAGDDWRWNAHYSLWTAPKLRFELEAAGFEGGSITTNSHPNLCAWAVKS